MSTPFADPLETFAPPLQTCARCGDVVLRVPVDGRTVALDATGPIEFPVRRCPVCHDQPTRRGSCVRCWGTGHVGEPEPRVAVAMGPDDLGRVWRRGERRQREEALYHRHRCASG